MGELDVATDMLGKFLGREHQVVLNLDTVGLEAVERGEHGDR